MTIGMSHRFKVRVRAGVRVRLTSVLALVLVIGIRVMGWVGEPSRISDTHVPGPDPGPDCISRLAVAVARTLGEASGILYSSRGVESKAKFATYHTNWDPRVRVRSG